MERVNAVGTAPRHNPRQQSNWNKSSHAKEDGGDDSSDKQPRQPVAPHLPELSELQLLVKQLNILGKTKPPHLVFNLVTSEPQLTINMSDGITNVLLRNIPAEEFFNIAKELLNEGTSLSEHPGQWVDLDV